MIMSVGGGGGGAYGLHLGKRETLFHNGTFIASNYLLCFARLLHCHTRFINKDSLLSLCHLIHHLDQ